MEKDLLMGNKNFVQENLLKFLEFNKWDLKRQIRPSSEFECTSLVLEIQSGKWPNID